VREWVEAKFNKPGKVELRNRLWPSFAPVYAVVGLVLNPLFPFRFARETWHNLDVAAGVLLLASLAFASPADEQLGHMPK